MNSRRDQAQAQTYVLGRLNSALVIGDPEAQEGPHRRILVGVIAGLLVSALVVAGFVVYGLLWPGGATAWREPKTLVVEKETGSRYVLAGGALHPVRNYASAVLLLGADLTVARVSSASLRSTPRGMPVGIVGAPDSLPEPGALDRTAWSVCGMVDRDEDGERVPATTLAIRRSATGHRLTDQRGLLARTGDLTFLVWHGHRYELTADWIPEALGYDAPPMEVEPGWLNQLATGPDIGPLDVPGRGDDGPEVDGLDTRVGQVFVARVIGSGNRYYLLFSDGLSRLSATAAALVLADPATAEAYGSEPVAPVELTPAGVTRLPKSERGTLPTGAPQTPPRPATPASGQTWCVQRAVPKGRVTVTAEPVVSGLRATRDGTGVRRTGHTAEAVAVAGGAGGVVRLGRPGQAGGTQLFLVTDPGISYPFADPAVAEAMGY
ncbi:MAG: type VII secretion protein EccB, partial [Micromonosporaceae bacterium]